MDQSSKTEERAAGQARPESVHPAAPLGVGAQARSPAETRMQILTPETRTEVGRFYMVRCIRLIPDRDKSWSGWGGRHSSSDASGWTPIIGPEHHDRGIINFPAMHFHVDVRFLSARTLRRHSNPFAPERSPEQCAMTMPVSTWSDGIGGHQPIPHEFAVRRKKCMRAMPDFPAAKEQGAQRPAVWKKLEDQHADCKLKPGLVCPHRGIHLAPFARPDGTAICPGHGLQWNLTTGELIRRHSQEPKSSPVRAALAAVEPGAQQ